MHNKFEIFHWLHPVHYKYNRINGMKLKNSLISYLFTHRTMPNICIELYSGGTVTVLSLYSIDIHFNTATTDSF